MSETIKEQEIDLKKRELELRSKELDVREKELDRKLKAIEERKQVSVGIGRGFVLGIKGIFKISVLFGLFCFLWFCLTWCVGMGLHYFGPDDSYSWDEACLPIGAISGFVLAVVISCKLNSDFRNLVSFCLSGFAKKK